MLLLLQIRDKPGKCNKRTKGDQVVIKDREGEARLLICDQNGKTFRWKMIDGKNTSSKTLGLFVQTMLIPIIFIKDEL